MDPVSASVVVGLLARYAKHLAGIAESKLDEATDHALTRLWAAVRSRLSNDPHAVSTLDRVAEQPENELRQAALQGYLAEAMEADRAFALELARLAQPVTNTTVTADIRNSGAVAAGGSVQISGTIAAGRDVVRPPSVEDPT
jgi:uncharacterized protein (DUF2126 family)